MRIAVFSATSLIAQCCVAKWAESGSHEFLLIGRSRSRLNAVRDDFVVRFPSSKFEVIEMDFDSVDSIEAVGKAVMSSRTDIALIAQGSLTKQSEVASDLVHLKQQLELNAVSVGLLLEQFVGLFEKQGSGRIGVIGSVAGDRQRSSLYTYGAAKAFIEHYVKGLQHRLYKSAVSVCLIKPGPIATPMTAGLTWPVASPEKTASTIVTGMAKKRRVIYVPRIWRVVMFVVRSIPFGIFKYIGH